MAKPDKANPEETTSVVRVQGIAQANDPFYERFGLIIPCNEPAVFVVDTATLEGLQALPYIRLEIVPEAPEEDPGANI